ncbi:hypothetical protein [Providencia manganoxydans]|uniref:hypothetical protein n=1 Tax=Providencia manganoxydans TaxID=2923283 RepID=UPI0032DBA988
MNLSIKPLQSFINRISHPPSLNYCRFSSVLVHNLLHFQQYKHKLTGSSINNFKHKKKDAGLLKIAIGAPRSPVNNCRSRITSNLSDMQFYEPERCSGEVCNIEEYGFAFIETDVQNAAGSEISQGRQQRQISRIELNEQESELRP